MDAKGPNVPVGSHTGHPDNPLYHTRDREYFGSPEKGDTIRPAFMYREFQANTSYIDRTVAYYISAFFWFWMFYHLYYFPGHIFGHHHAPYLEEFTDEELGIPDDNAPDPEYWGNHYEKPGTYR
ncbi:unnamed protein product [Dracunculus medinensis]|uniref:NADH dehydrogenase [ubiquinone] 1 beta subcomplex subunit 2, mitochondrial n=1 Tax=Dracunculus medinensis TaxID=318479 RepID=A0A3P7T3A4_DRAME|nr:unnamed protein product [Dracunculus medinensis]